MIKVICVGKLKEKYLISLVEDYLNRVNKYHKLNIISNNRFIILACFDFQEIYLLFLCNLLPSL